MTIFSLKYIKPSGEIYKVVKNFDEYDYIINGNYTVPHHPFIQCLEFRKFRPEIVHDCNTYLLKSIFGKNKILNITKNYNCDVCVKVSSEKNNDLYNRELKDMSNKLKGMDFFCKKDMDDLLSKVKTYFEIKPSIETSFKFFYYILEYLYDFHDVINSLTCVQQVNRVLIAVYDIENLEIDVFQECRIIEQFNNYFHLCSKYSIKNRDDLKKAIKERKKMPQSLHYIFRHRSLGGISYTLDSGGFFELNEFMLNGKFNAYPNFPPYIIPYSDNPEDGLIFKFIFPLVSFLNNSRFDPNVRKNLRDNIQSIYKQLLVSYEQIYELIKNLQLHEFSGAERTIFNSIHIPLNSIILNIRTIFSSACIQKFFETILQTYNEKIQSS